MPAAVVRQFQQVDLAGKARPEELVETCFAEVGSEQSAAIALVGINCQGALVQVLRILIGSEQPENLANAVGNWRPAVGGTDDFCPALVQCVKQLGRQFRALAGEIEVVNREAFEQVRQPQAVIRVVVREDDAVQPCDAHAAESRSDQLLSGVDA